MADDSLDTDEMLESHDDFEAAYRSHAAPIYRFLYWRTGDASLSEDLTSTVFEKAWRSRHSFHGGSVRAWLNRIARNSLTDHWRKKKEIYTDNLEALDEAEDAIGLSPADALDLKLRVEDLRQALATLPNDMRQVVQLRFIEGLSARQTGQRLNLSEGNVRVMQYRALRKLRSKL